MHILGQFSANECHKGPLKVRVIKNQDHKSFREERRKNVLNDTQTKWKKVMSNPETWLRICKIVFLKAHQILYYFFHFVFKLLRYCHIDILKIFVLCPFIIKFDHALPL